MSPIDVLIAGGGVAGPTFAYWLKKATDASITIVERSPSPRLSGQAVDIRGPGVDVIDAMGITELIRAKTTTEEGTRFVDSSGNTKASFPATGDARQQSITSEFEILRSDLTKIMLDVSKDSARVVYDEYITGIEQQANGKVEVQFANHLPKTSFDLVVAADGMISKTRRLVFGTSSDGHDHLRKLGQYMAYFTIPRLEIDGKMMDWYAAGRGRCVLTRPDPYGETRVMLGVTNSNLAKLERFDSVVFEGAIAQKKLLREEFADAGGQIDRFLDEMDRTEDFYYQMIAQTKLKDITKGRFALIGDAGYCPSPISGMGTTLALVGAYVLAGEISKSPDDIPRALENYQTTLRPLIDQAQKLLPGAPQIANPQSQMGVFVFNNFMSFLSTPWIMNTFSNFAPAFSSKKWTAPAYPKLA